MTFIENISFLYKNEESLKCFYYIMDPFFCNDLNCFFIDVYCFYQQKKDIFMNELESYILDFEALTGCKLVIHNNLTSFFKIRKQESEENLFDTCHQDLRKVFPCCGSSSVCRSRPSRRFWSLS